MKISRRLAAVLGWALCFLMISAVFPLIFAIAGWLHPR